MLVGIEFIERTPRYDYMLCQVRTEINRLCKEKDYGNTIKNEQARKIQWRLLNPLMKSIKNIDFGDK